MSYDNTNRGTLNAEENKKTPKHPDYWGQINIEGKEYRLSGWKRKSMRGPFISLTVQPKDSASSTSSPSASESELVRCADDDGVEYKVSRKMAEKLGYRILGSAEPEKRQDFDDDIPF